MLKVREDHVRTVLDEARRRLGEITKDSAKYSDIQVKLIVQGLFQIMEPKATIKCRQSDVALIESLLPTALENYKAKMGKDINITLDKESFLPQDTCGGVILYALNGRLRVIKISNFILSSIALILNCSLFRFRIHSNRVWN